MARPKQHEAAPANQGRENVNELPPQLHYPIMLVNLVVFLQYKNCETSAEFWKTNTIIFAICLGLNLVHWCMLYPMCRKMTRYEEGSPEWISAWNQAKPLSILYVMGNIVLAYFYYNRS